MREICCQGAIIRVPTYRRHANLRSGTSLFLAEYHVGTREFAIRVLTFSSAITSKPSKVFKTINNLVHVNSTHLTYFRIEQLRLLTLLSVFLDGID
jgi:hypothetical protein